MSSLKKQYSHKLQKQQTGSGNQKHNMSDIDNKSCYYVLKLRGWLKEKYKKDKNYCYEYEQFKSIIQQREQRQKTGKDYRPKQSSPLRNVWYT